MFEENVTQGPGSGAVSTYTFEILIMLSVAFLLGVWLGWMLWNRFKQKADKLRLDLESLTVTLNAATAELNGLKTRLAVSDADNNNLRAQVAKLSEENRIYRDQLAETGEDLSETQERNRQLETELGLSLQPDTPTPETIPLEISEPADKPAEESLSGAADIPAATVTVETPETQTTVVVETKEPGAGVKIEVSPQPAEDLPKEEADAPVAEVAEPVVETPVAIAAADDGKDDLTVVEGIGPKIQELLYQYGIQTYRQLAETDVARLKEILSAAGPQLAMHDPGTWPSQANLAANDQWEALKSIQGFLKGGKKPT